MIPLEKAFTNLNRVDLSSRCDQALIFFLFSLHNISQAKLRRRFYFVNSLYDAN